MSISSLLVEFKCSFIPNAPYRVCFSFCLDAKRNKRSRLSLFARPAMDSKAKTKEKHLMLISFCFLTLSFALRVPRATGKVGKPDGRQTKACVSPGASEAQPLADKRSRRKTKRADRQ